MDLLFCEAFTFVLTTGLVLFGALVAAERRAAALAAFVGFALVQSLVLTGSLALGWHVGHWNWVGKFASIAVGLAAVWVLGLTRDEVGLVQPRGRRGWIVSVAGLAAGLLFTVFVVVVFGPNPAPSLETLAYQATMPGLEEELSFRGIGMALLARGFARTRAGIPAWTLPVGITSLQFILAGLRRRSSSCCRSASCWH